MAKYKFIKNSFVMGTFHSLAKYIIDSSIVTSWKEMEKGLDVMVKTNDSRFLSSPNLDIVTVSFDKLNKTDLFLQIQEVYM